MSESVKVRYVLWKVSGTYHVSGYCSGAETNDVRSTVFVYGKVSYTGKTHRRYFNRNSKYCGNGSGYCGHDIFFDTVGVYKNPKSIMKFNRYINMDRFAYWFEKAEPVYPDKNYTLVSGDDNNLPECIDDNSYEEDMYPRVTSDSSSDSFPEKKMDTPIVNVLSTRCVCESVCRYIKNCKYGNKCKYAHLVEEFVPRKCKFFSNCRYKNGKCYRLHDGETKNELFDRLTAID
jgi:hypothetical protein